MSVGRKSGTNPTEMCACSHAHHHIATTLRDASCKALYITLCAHTSSARMIHLWTSIFSSLFLKDTVPFGIPCHPFTCPSYYTLLFTILTVSEELVIHAPYHSQYKVKKCQGLQSVPYGPK